MANDYKVPVPAGVTNATHKRVTMRNILDNVHGQRYIVTHEAVDFVPNDQVDAYVTDAQKRWMEVVTTNPNAAAPPVQRG